MLPVRLQQVADKAKVSRSTASRALRSDPRISKPTTERVQKAARELKYTPDPVISRWAAGAWKKRRSEKSGYEIAFISDTEKPDDSTAYTSARKKASDLGYSLNYFSLPAYENWSRLNQVIRARSIPGVILNKSVAPTDLFETSHLSIVCSGVSDNKLPYHTVHLDTFLQMETIWQQAMTRSARKIFLWLQESKESLHGRLHYGAALECEQQHRSQAEIVKTQFGFIPPESAAEQVLESGADFVISMVTNDGLLILDNLRKRGWKGQWLVLRTYPGSGFSGMLPHDDLVAIESMNLLDRMIRNFQTGVPSNPLTVLVTPDWHEDAGEAQ
jgi:LacI family transcriptional regulator